MGKFLCILGAICNCGIAMCAFPARTLVATICILAISIARIFIRKFAFINICSAPNTVKIRE
jgi:hypothetical protein